MSNRAGSVFEIVITDSVCCSNSVFEDCRSVLIGVLTTGRIDLALPRGFVLRGWAVLMLSGAVAVFKNESYRCCLAQLQWYFKDCAYADVA